VGTHVSALPDESILLNKSIDALAVGEYDVTIREVADTLYADKDLTEVKGLYLRMENDKIIKTGSRILVNDLDIFPMVSKIYNRFLDIFHFINNIINAAYT